MSSTKVDDQDPELLDLPPVPVAATCIDDLAATLRELRVWAGEPSFSTLAKRIAQLRRARGVPAADATPGRVTVYDCFKAGRRRIDIGLMMDIVAALGADPQTAALWRQSIRRVLSPGAGPTLAEVSLNPAPPEGFVGRSSEIARIVELAAEGAVVIHGMAGVGKTALALRAAHALSAAVTGGLPILLVNLRGFVADREPVEGDSVIGALLRALDQDLPMETGHRSLRLSALLRQRGVVVILDNAASVEQLAGILPVFSQATRVLITSRNRLDEIPGATGFPVGELSADEAVALLARSAGRTCDDEPADETTIHQLRVLADLAGHLPLALELMGRRLAAHPDWPLTDHIEAYRTRLTLLQLDQGLQAALELSYAALSPDEQLLLRSLTWHPGHTLALPGVDALTREAIPDLPGVMAQLSTAHLVRPVGEDRYELHDLIRAFAAARSFDIDPPSRRLEAVEALITHQRDEAAKAVAAVHPQAAQDWWWRDAPPLAMEADEAARWLDAERVNLMAGATWAAQHDRPRLVVQLASVLAHDLWRRGDVEATVELHRAAIEAAVRAGDDFGRGMGERNLGNTLIRIGAFDAARPHLQQALAVFEDGSPAHAATLNSLAILASATGDHEAAVASFSELVTQLRQQPEAKPRLVLMLSNLAVTLARTGRAEEAIDLFRESAELAAELGLAEQEWVALGNLAGMLVDAGRPEEGLAVARRAAELTARVDDPLSVAYIRSNLGSALHAVGDDEAAQENWGLALATARELSAPELEASVLNHMGDGHRSRGRGDEARACYRQALAVAEPIGEANESERARDGLAALA